MLMSIYFTVFFSLIIAFYIVAISHSSNRTAVRARWGCCDSWQWWFHHHIQCRQWWRVLCSNGIWGWFRTYLHYFPSSFEGLKIQDSTKGSTMDLYYVVLGSSPDSDIHFKPSSHLCKTVYIKNSNNNKILIVFWVVTCHSNKNLWMVWPTGSYKRNQLVGHAFRRNFAFRRREGQKNCRLGFLAKLQENNRNKGNWDLYRALALHLTV